MDPFTFWRHSMDGLPRVATQWILDHAAALVVGLVLLGPFAITYLRTHWQSLRDRADSFRHKKQINPPHAPYSIPWLRNGLAIGLDTQGFITRMQKRFGKEMPFRMGVAGDRWVYIPSGELVSAMIRSGHMSNKKGTLNILGDVFGLPRKDVSVWERDDSGHGLNPAPGFENWMPEQRIYFLQHRNFKAYFTGVPLDLTTARFVDKYRHNLLIGRTDISVSGEWTELLDLYQFLRDEMFHATVHALFGEHIFEVCPNLTAEFWAYERALNYLVKRVPRWLAPRFHIARDTAIESIRRWQASAHEQFEWGNEAAVNADWEPLFGARVMRARQESFLKAGLSPTGIAVMDLALLRAANTNIIPATFWTFMHIIQSPNITARARAEVEASTMSPEMTLDLPTLFSKPLLNSLYLEGLRFCVATTVARSPVGTSDVSLGRWRIAVDASMYSMSWFGAHDETFWNSGPGGAHPVDEFWAERFLAYPDDPGSGPLRNKEAAGSDKSGRQKARQPQPGKYEKIRTIEDDKTATVVTSGMQGHLYPYGGGLSYCPGRFFAKKEMIASIATLLLNFDVEIIDAKAAATVRLDKVHFSLGAMPPDRKVAARIRRRRRELANS